MNKNRELNEIEIKQKIENYNPFIINLIENSRASLNLEKSEFRILDYGCGRGKNVAALLNFGYNAWGVDVDPSVIKSARIGLKNQAHRVIQIDIDNSLPFKRDTFHFVISEHVIEHIKYLEKFAESINYVIVENGCSYNVYPAKWRIIEPHLGMPFIHLVKSEILRKFLISFYVMLSIHPKWDTSVNSQLIKRYHSYISNKVFHRSNRSILNIFGKYFNCHIITYKNSKIVNSVRKLIKLNFLAIFFVKFIIPHFLLAHVLFVKPSKNKFHL